MQRFIAILMMPGYDIDATYDDSGIPIAISSDGSVIVIRAPDNDRNMISHGFQESWEAHGKHKYFRAVRELTMMQGIT